jgi:hypothetical protein
VSSKVAATVWVTSVNVDAADSHVKSQVRNSVEDGVRGGADGELCVTLFRWCQHASAYVCFVGVSQDTILCLLRAVSHATKIRIVPVANYLSGRMIHFAGPLFNRFSF